MKILNVIEVVGTADLRVTSFVISDLIDDETPEEDIIKQAEELFWKCAEENGAHIQEKKKYIEDGYFSLDSHEYKLFLSWSE